MNGGVRQPGSPHLLSAPQLPHLSVGLRRSTLQPKVADFFSTYRVELLAQSLLFILSAGAWLWFLGSLRSYLMRFEGGTGRLASIAFGAGVVGIGIQALIQAPQSALAMASSNPVEPSLAVVMANMGYAFNIIAYVPLAVMLAAVALISLRTAAFPNWIGWLSGLGAVSLFVMSAGIAVDSGPLAAGALPTFIPYAAMAAWLLGTSVVMFKRAGRHSDVTIPDTPEALDDTASSPDYTR